MKIAGRMSGAIAAAALLLLALGSGADDALDGEQLYGELGCVYCHGAAGREPALPEYPKLAGQNAAYLTQQTQDIKSTARDNGYTGMMQPAVASITDAEIAAISAYLAAQSR